ADVDVAHHGTLWTIGAFFIIEVDLQDRVGDLTDFHVAEVHVFDGSAAHCIGLEAQRLIQTRAGQFAVLGEHVPDSARHFTSDSDAPVTILHFAIPDDHILRWDGNPAAISIPPGLDGDAIVPGIEGTVFDQDIAAGIRITAVVVGPVAHDLDVAHGH